MGRNMSSIRNFKIGIEKNISMQQARIELIFIVFCLEISSILKKQIKNKKYFISKKFYSLIKIVESYLLKRLNSSL